MKYEIRILLRDIQAAARIGHTESLWAALENLQGLAQVAGNHPMDETFLNQVILPVGEAVARAQLSHATLRPLTAHALASYRAIAAVALLRQYLEGRNGTTLKSLNILVQDPRQDVRAAIRLAAGRAEQADPDKLNELYETWQASSSPRVQALAFQILPNLPQEIALQKIEMLETEMVLNQPEAKKTLAATLAALAANGHAGKVFQILARWAAQPDPDDRIITLSLSKAWAAEYPAESLAILTQLAAKTGPHKRIRRTLESLYRHGAEDKVKAALEDWRSAQSPQLRAAGQDEKLTF